MIIERISSKNKKYDKTKNLVRENKIRNFFWLFTCKNTLPQCDQVVV